MMSKMRCNSASPGGVIFCLCPPKEVDLAIHSSRSNKAGREKNAGRIDIGQNVYGKPCHEVFKMFYNIKERHKSKMEEKTCIQTRQKIRKVNKRRENEKLDAIQCLKPELSRIISRGIFSRKRIIDQANLHDSSLPCKRRQLSV